MTPLERLPNSVLVQYGELMQNCVLPRSDGSNLSFKSKEIRGKRYWYLYISVGSTRREHYLGEETAELLNRIDDEKALWESGDDDRELRRRLVDMLVAGGMKAPSRDEGKILALLERSGIFLAGAALVGTVAFRAYANMLGVIWPRSIGTQDIDIAADNRFTVALPRPRSPINLGQLILDSGLGFVEVPVLDRRQPSTSFKVRKRDFRIDVLAPMRGEEAARPIRLEDFQTFAMPLRDLDYVLEDVQAAVLLHGHGILVNVPAPGRFAVHKCVTSQRRATALATKAQKDVEQAEQLFHALLDWRPVEITRALQSARGRDPSFLVDFEAGLGLMDAEIATAVREHDGGGR